MKDHYGSWNVEQRTLVTEGGWVDLSGPAGEGFEVVALTGPERLTWLDSLSANLAPGAAWSWNAILSPQGHVERLFRQRDDGDTTHLVTEPGTGDALIAYLERMRFWTQVEIARVDLPVIWAHPGTLSLTRPEGEPTAGFLAYEALRIARGEPSLRDVDDHTLPNEIGILAVDHSVPVDAVLMDKGCYRGQEAVARTWNLGRPPRRLTLLHLDGSMNQLPAVGAEVVTAEGTVVGRMGSSARHHELGPIGLALLKRNTDPETGLRADGVPASQQILVDPEVGLHFRASQALGTDPQGRARLL